MNYNKSEKLDEIWEWLKTIKMLKNDLIIGYLKFFFFRLVQIKIRYLKFSYNKVSIYLIKSNISFTFFC